MLKCIVNRLSNKIINRGKNNQVIIDKTVLIKKCKIKIWGNNNTIIINPKAYLHRVYIRIGFEDCPINNCRITIGQNTSINSADIQMGESNSQIIIGDDCMFSFDIEIACSDTHAIINNNCELINIGRKIEIGNHVWVCKEVKILKNTKIPNNTIIAQNSIITKEFDIENTIIAGIPAKIVKEGINWLRERPEKIVGGKNAKSICFNTNI